MNVFAWLAGGALAAAGLNLAPRRWRLSLAVGAVRWIFRDIPQASVRELRERLARGERIELWDVRRAEEYEVSRIPGAKRIDEKSEIARLLEGLPPGVPVVVYCSAGYRSGKLARRLREAGLDRVTNLAGSIFAWAAESYPLENAAGAVREVHPYNRVGAWFLPRGWARRPRGR